MSLEEQIAKIKLEIEEAGPLFAVHIDDESELLEVIGDRLKDFGVQVLSFSDPHEAIKVIRYRQSEICFIVSDFKMPNVNGFEVREQLLPTAGSIPFAILSAFIDREMALKGVELKICGFLNKPLNEQEICDLFAKEALPRVRALKEERELRIGFVSDCEGLFEESEELLLKIEADPSDAASLDRLFAVIHTLKGASGFFESKSMNQYTHRYEEILKKLQKQELVYDEAVAAKLFHGFDVIKELFSEFKTGIFKVRDLERLFADLNLEASNTAKTASALADQSAATPDVPKVAADKPKSKEDVKVNVKLLDEFMALSGEVTVIRNMLNKCVQAIEKRFTGDRDVGMLSELLTELHKINSGVQNKITEIRKVSLKNVTKGLPRAVRDVSKAVGKPVDLKIVGEELRVDTSLAEVLNNSLLHIVKNSIDHGLETPIDRKQTGKSETGQITVSASTRDDKVVIEIQDDGRGLNVEAIKAKLLKNGQHTSDEIAKMSNDELYAMIFSSGFSTAAKVTDISGRGVGMSMVKDSVDSVGGQIVIESKAGQGAKFTLVLPTPKSVLISNCLSVRVGAMQMGLIQDDIQRVFQFDHSQRSQHIKELEGTTVLEFEDSLVPVIDLAALLDLPHESSASALRDLSKVVLLQLPQDKRRVAVAVDEILEVEDLVIKNIHGFLNHDSLFRGVTFQDDGRVGVILNTAGILNRSGVKAEKKLEQTAQRGSRQAVDGAPVTENLGLLFDLGTPGVYAFEQKSVFRIEQVNQSAFTQSGSSTVMPYRGQVIQVLDPRALFETRPTLDAVDRVVDLLVVHSNETLVGLVLNRVIDMAPLLDLKTDLAQPSKAILGHCFVGTQTVSVMSAPELVRLLTTERSNVFEFSEAAQAVDGIEQLAA